MKPFQRNARIKWTVAVFSTAAAVILAELIVGFIQTAFSPTGIPFGLKTTTAAEANPDVSFRVLSYGDSIGHGFGVQSEEAYARILERRLSEQRPTQVVISEGYCPTIYASQLRRLFADFHPQRVVVEVELSNDISDEALIVWHGESPEDTSGGRYRQAWNGGLIRSVGSDRWFVQRTRLYHLGLRAWGNMRNMFMNNPAFSPQADTYYYNLGYDRPWLSPPDLERGFAHMFTSLSWIKAACDRAGIPLLLVILPSRYAFSENQYHRGALRLIANAEAEAKRRGIPFISLRSAFAAGGGDELYFDFCHPKPAGHRVIAQAIYERLRQP